MQHDLPRFDNRMSDAEALMWRVEKDPFLTSTFGNITVLDARPNFEAFVQRMDRASRVVPRLRQRVQPAPAIVGAPTWVTDTEFTIRHHVRYMALPAPGTMRQLTDLASLITADAFDRARPLWQFTIVDGLAGGKSALIQKLHHTITDGQGGVALSMQFLDLERNSNPPPPLPPQTTEAPQARGTTDLLTSTFADAMRAPLGALRQVRELLSDPTQLPGLGVQAAATVRELLAELNDVDNARSPLWTQRSIQRLCMTLRAPYRPMLEASRALGGKMNTAFLAATADAAGQYHRELGMPVESLRTSMAISTRSESSGGNAFTLARLLVPTGEMPIAERFSAINEAVSQAREQSKSASLDTLATMSSLLPTSVLARIARAQSQTVDFATSNVRGAGIPLYICGAKVLENYPIGPLGGVAFNLTMLSYNHSLDMGLNIDTAAVAEPERLQRCIQNSLFELMEYAPKNVVGIPAPPKKRVKRLLQELRLRLATSARRGASRLPRR
jgi:WS/DGAT/MGAT family acyltransferase